MSITLQEQTAASGSRSDREAAPGQAARAGRRLAGFDGLRAFACLTVFLANIHHSMGITVSGHAGPMDLAYFAESGIGVAMLIAISGALISAPLWRRLESDATKVSWAAFALRRAVRLIPAYYACLLAYMLLSGHRPEPRDALVHFLFVNNLWEPSFYSISPQFWTIGMFVQFYFVIPIVFAALARLRLKGPAAAALVGLLAVATYLLHWLLMATRPGSIVWPVSALTTADGVVLSHSTLAHLPQFLLGIVCGRALLVLRSRQSAPWASNVLFDVVFWTAAGAAIAMAAVPALALQPPYARYLFPLLPLFLCAAIVTVPFAPLASRVLEFAPLRGLGTISYGVYVYHMLCLTVVAHLMGAPVSGAPGEKVTFALAGLALTIVVATASYLVLERPLLRQTARRSAR